MQLSAKLLFGFLVVCSATGVLATYIPDRHDYGTCDDGNPRKLAAAASQAGPLPYCSSYVSTSTVIETETAKATVTITADVTKTVVSEKDAKTTVVSTKTITGTPLMVTTTVPVTTTSGATVTTTTTLPVVTVTSTSLILKRDHDHPESTSTKCSCIVLFSTTTVSSTKTETSFLAKTTTITKTDIDTEVGKTTLTVTPTSITTVSVTTTVFSTTTTTQTLASTTTIVKDVPSACANMPGSASITANTLSHPEGNYESTSPGQGTIVSDIVACCTECWNLPGCFSFNFGNFNPEQIPPQLGANYCQVFVGINAGSPVENTCPSPERVNFISFTNPGTGPNDFFEAGVGPCSSGIDFSTI